MPKKINIIPGDKYGRLTIVREISLARTERHFECLCICGKTGLYRLSSLRNGHVKSCGCLRKDTNIKNNSTHCSCKTRLYSIWSKMKDRCYNKKSRGYAYYGSRGIKVCDEWLEFSSFQKWALTNGYSDHLTIERNDFNEMYCPENCRWIPQSEQPKNSRHNVFVTINGESICLSDAIRKIGISRTHFYRRLKSTSLKEALLTPVKK